MPGTGKHLTHSIHPILAPSQEADTSIVPGLQRRKRRAREVVVGGRQSWDPTLPVLLSLPRPRHLDKQMQLNPLLAPVLPAGLFHPPGLRLPQHLQQPLGLSQSVTLAPSAGPSLVGTAFSTLRAPGSKRVSCQSLALNHSARNIVKNNKPSLCQFLSQIQKARSRKRNGRTN